MKIPKNVIYDKKAKLTPNIPSITRGPLRENYGTARENYGWLAGQLDFTFSFYHVNDTFLIFL